MPARRRIAAGEPMQLVTGYGILKTTEDFVPVLLQRRHAQSTVFVWAISLSGDPVGLRVSPVADESGAALPSAEVTLVQLDGEGGHWSILVNPLGEAATVRLADGPPRVTHAQFAVY